MDQAKPPIGSVGNLGLGNNSPYMAKATCKPCETQLDINPPNNQLGLNSYSVLYRGASFICFLNVNCLLDMQQISRYTFINNLGCRFRAAVNSVRVST